MTDLLTVLVKGEYSRFQQRGFTTYFCEEDMFMYPQVTDRNGVRILDISASARHHGIQSKTLVSSKLFSTWIREGAFSPERNIAMMCHAFLYAVDLDVEGLDSLEFSVHFYPKQGNFVAVNVRARTLLQATKENILLELSSE